VLLTLREGEGEGEKRDEKEIEREGGRGRERERERERERNRERCTDSFLHLRQWSDRCQWLISPTANEKNRIRKRREQNEKK
jgi:hypothetical protein